MIVYYINLLIILGLAWPLCVHKPAKWKTIAYLAVTFGYMWFLATFRQGIGWDYQDYIDIFAAIRDTNTLQGLIQMPYEYGFTFLTKGMTFFISSSVVMYGFYAALVLLPVAWFIYRYCKTVWLSTWLYVTLTFYYTSLSFIRQALACSFLLLGYKFMREKKPIPFIAVVILGALFHKTCLILIPIYFLCHIKLDKKWGIIYGSVTVFLYLTSELILDFATRFVFTYYRGTYYIDPQYGFSPVFLIVPFLLFGGCLALWPVWRKRDPDADMNLNLMMYSAIVWLFITRHFILERFSMPTYFFALVAVPAAISALLSPPEDHQKLQELTAQAERSKADKALQGQIRSLKTSIKEHRMYYRSAVVALLLLTAVYNDFGANVNTFHNVFPYQSVFQWINNFIQATF